MAEVIAIVLATTAVTVGTYSAIEGYQNQKYQADLAEENARIQMAQLEYNKRLEEREAAAIEAEGNENARRLHEQAEILKAQQRALLGKSGAAMAAGSPLAILGQTASDEELKIQDSLYMTARQSAAARSKAADYEFGYALAQQDMTAAKASRPTGLSLGMNLTGAAITPFINYANYQKSGVAVEKGGKALYKTLAGGGK